MQPYTGQNDSILVIAIQHRHQKQAFNVCDGGIPHFRNSFQTGINTTTQHCLRCLKLCQASFSLVSFSLVSCRFSLTMRSKLQV